jgi:hypothetical protein
MGSNSIQYFAWVTEWLAKIEVMSTMRLIVLLAFGWFNIFAQTDDLVVIVLDVGSGFDSLYLS